MIVTSVAACVDMEQPRMAFLTLTNKLRNASVTGTVECLHSAECQECVGFVGQLNWIATIAWEELASTVPREALAMRNRVHNCVHKIGICTDAA